MKKFQIAIIAIVILVIAGFFISQETNLFISARRNPRASVSPVDLDRPLVVGLVSWPGFVGGPMANRGFKENSDSIFTKKYGLSVRFVLIEDIDARGKAFAKGGPGGVDAVWSSIDFWANELPGFMAGGIEGRAFLQIDWSRGGDAMVADKTIKSIEDLKDKKIALTQFTPSHWLLENALRQSQLTRAQQDSIRANLIFTQDASAARQAFVAGHVDAAVTWEPDVSQALKRDDAHILISSKDLPNIIADMLVAKKDFIEEHPKAIEALMRGWLEGVQETRENPELAARLLMENEPLFGDLGIEGTKASLSWVYLPDLEDNANMFGLDGSAPLFDSIFENAGRVWQELGVIKTPIEAKDAKDDSILRKIYREEHGM